VKKKSRGAFSLIEVMVAIAIFSIAATALTVGVANGLLCCNSMINHRPDFFEYAFALHIVKNSASISSATGISKLTLPSGRIMQIKAAITTTGVDNLFSVNLAIDDSRYEIFLANGNWQ
jgi:prepilin-type N-terminal cleavage/methylation domain-containing protein